MFALGVVALLCSHIHDGHEFDDAHSEHDGHDDDDDYEDVDVDIVGLLLVLLLLVFVLMSDATLVCCFPQLLLMSLEMRSLIFVSASRSREKSDSLHKRVLLMNEIED